ncbi:MAG: type II toxin-antitoxin system HicB family antitoxin [Oscillibacter sp.]|nr:type II toxin-antitoxin system HicB family antitoxin [Oscillibacter sp.]
MKYLYSAVFSPIEGSTAWSARVPDLPGCVTTGKDLPEALEMITDAASLWLVVAEDKGMPIAEPTPQTDLERGPGDVCALIRVDTITYRAQTDTRAVRKNVSLPAWMANLADKRGLNCSQILQESLLQRLS